MLKYFKEEAHKRGKNKFEPYYRYEEAAADNPAQCVEVEVKYDRGGAQFWDSSQNAERGIYLSVTPYTSDSPGMRCYTIDFGKNMGFKILVLAQARMNARQLAVVAATFDPDAPELAKLSLAGRKQEAIARCFELAKKFAPKTGETSQIPRPGPGTATSPEQTSIAQSAEPQAG